MGSGWKGSIQTLLAIPDSYTKALPLRLTYHINKVHIGESGRAPMSCWRSKRQVCRKARYHATLTEKRAKVILAVSPAVPEADICPGD
jgi:hypothetical protein